MIILRIIFKLTVLLLHLVIGVAKVFALSLGSDKDKSNKRVRLYLKQWLLGVTNIIGLDIEVVGDKNSIQQSALWVSNHVSWMDIAVVGSQGVGFLSKAEIRKWPLLGWLGNKGGTVFIERGQKNASQNAAKAIAEKILGGDRIVVFPEATTTTGENVKRFHARIFAPALDHHLLVQPVALQYLDEKNQAHPQVSWVNESFIKNVLGILAQPRIRVILTFLPVIDAKEFKERKQVAEIAENTIRDVVIASQTVKVA